MSIYKVMTARKEQDAQPGAMYYIDGVNTENEAIEAVYDAIQKKHIKPASFLREHFIPDYTCAVLVPMNKKEKGQ